MRYILIALLIYSFSPSIAQTTFNQEYDIGGYYSHFHDLAYSNDTITLYGFFYGQEEEQWGMVVMQIDTSGNFLHQHEYFDEDGRDYGLPWFYPIMKLSDGSGYLATGMEYESKNAFIIKLDREGKKQFIQEFEYPYSDRNHFMQLLELEDGILVSGSKQQGTGNRNCATLMKLDFSLNQLWSQNYCPEYPDRRYDGMNLTKIDSTSFIVSIANGPVIGSVPVWEMDSQSEIWGINSLGLPQWKWKNSIGLDEIGMGRINRLADGNWGYMTKEGWYNTQYNEISSQPKYVVRNEDFELVREDTFGIADNRLRGLGSPIKLSGGGFVAAGRTPWLYNTPPSFSDAPYNAIAGWMVRLDEYGQKMWQRVDTAYWSQEFGSWSYLRNVIELPSGSLVACGYSEHFEPPTIRNKAWVIKVDANGCMDPLDCETIVSTQEELPVVAEPPLRMHVFPNPASGVIQVHLDQPAPALLQLYDVNGRLVRQEQTSFGTLSHRMEVRDLPNGMYWLKAQSNK
ncbi:MAG TPA: T9SS type A sorting domain-containing protein, partial [Phaeodactylibacter sp.]|nr:T9SS type A sorting domain-containing protein [Phaeodactylibacter sp.]